MKVFIMLSKAEIQYLQGQKAVSKTFEYKLNHSIKKKVNHFINKELPLLEAHQLLDLISIKTLGKAKVAGSIPAQGFLFLCLFFLYYGSSKAFFVYCFSAYNLQ